ncbi:MAG: ion transporter [Burkholderiaceae bacterium]|nr:ion transporter [Burkholderiaceae bacterium]
MPTSRPISAWRQRLEHLLAHPMTERVLIALIIVNAVVLGLETDKATMARWGALLTRIDVAILTVFVVEIALRLWVRRSAFFRDPWSVFDFIVIAIALVPATGELAVLRSLRILRALRLLSVVPSMRAVVAGLLRAIPGLGSITGVLAVIFYVSAVIATGLFGERFDAWFGSLGRSAYTLFQVMTLESWSMGIARPVMDAYPAAWIFFVGFILIATFTMLNLFIGVIVNAIQQTAADAAPETAAGEHIDVQAQTIRDELRALRGEIRKLHEAIGRR